MGRSETQYPSGDVIIAVDEEPVVNEDTLLSLLEKYQPGDQVSVTTMKNEDIYNYSIKLAEPPN